MPPDPCDGVLVSAPRCVILNNLPSEGRTRLDLSGADTRRFLQGLLSADVEKIATGEARAAALLSAKGKMVSDALVLGDGDRFSLWVPSEQASVVSTMLDRHIIMDDVQLAQPEDSCCALVWGVEGDLPELGATSEVTVFTTRHPAPGTLVLGTAAAVEAAVAPYTRAAAGDWARYRIEQGCPAWGHELEEGRLPPEVGFAGAISYDKGCFLGQEPLARIHARGQVNWVLVRIRAERLPTSIHELASEARSNVGRWTTWASATPDSAGSALGLAVVRRKVAVPGTRLSSEQGGEVEVLSLPLGDDPGL